MSSAPRGDRRPLIVFAGPTISPAQMRLPEPAVVLPSAAQGSVVRCVQAYDPAAILLIDAVFQGEPTVRHKEILWALSRGIAVYGAASMGALRAAELHVFGMVGVGLIYRWYRRYPLAPDDAVAVLHGPADIGSPPLSQSLIELRLSFRAAQRAGEISYALRRQLDAIAIGLNFRDRTLARVIDEVRARSPGGLARELVRAMPRLSSFDCRQKRDDAAAALARVTRDLASPTIKPSTAGTRPFVMTSAFARDLEDSGIVLE